MTVKLGVAELLTGRSKPDLVLSGINSGANIGPRTVISGAVGNVIAAISELDAPIPGIAFSTDLVDADPLSDADRRHFAQVAAFAARLVARLTRNGKIVGLDPGEGMKINYPPLARHLVESVRSAQHGFAPVFATTSPSLHPASDSGRPARSIPRRMCRDPTPSFSSADSSPWSWSTATTPRGRARTRTWPGTWTASGHAAGGPPIAANTGLLSATRRFPSGAGG